MYDLSVGMPFLYCFHLGLLCHFVHGGNSDAFTDPYKELYVMLQWVPVIGPYYIILIVIVNSSDHSGA